MSKRKRQMAADRKANQMARMKPLHANEVWRRAERRKAHSSLWSKAHAKG